MFDQIYKFDKKYSYIETTIDKEIYDLFCAIDALPGINVSGGTSGRGNGSVLIFFRVSSIELGGLFFLTRCCDRRYWKYGNHWSIDLSVGDVMVDNNRPTVFCLNSKDQVGETAYKQSRDLVENMNYHINHINFMKEYNLNADNFDVSVKRILLTENK